MRPLLFGILISATCGCLFAAGTDLMSLKDVKPGMRGFGMTIFESNQIEKFDVEIIDIIYNYRPQRDLIIVKLLGEKPAHTGIVSGMSGSPIYVDNKLIGALAYRIGNFMKEPIAGVTPIEQMFEIFSKEQIRPQELSIAAAAANLRLQRFLTNPPNDPFEILQLLRPFIEPDPAGIAPIEMPLLIRGLNPAFQQRINHYLSASGYVVLNGGQPDSNSAQIDAEIVPGSAVATVLVSGDFDISAIGTVTFRDKDRLLAFGHPFFNAGPVSLPLAQAKILTTLPSFAASNKLGMATKIIGNIRQDRSSGIMAILGEQPSLIPVAVTISLPASLKRQFHFNIANDRSLASVIPVYFWITLINALESARLGNGDYALRLTGRIQLEHFPEVILDNFYAGGGTGLFDGSGSDMPEAAYDIVMTLAALLANEFDVPTIHKIELDFEALPGQKLANLEQVFYSKEPVIPGENLEITIVLRPFRAERLELKQQITIPENLNAPSINLVVGSADEIKKWDTMAGVSHFVPSSLDELIMQLNRRRKNSEIIIQLRTSDAGAMLHGREFPTLPPSVLGIMTNKKTSKAYQLITEKVVKEWSIPTKMKIKGGKRFSLRVEPHH